MKKRWAVGGVLVLSLALGATALADGGLKILINGNPFDTGGIARIENGVTLAPAKQLAEALGAEVLWDGKTKTVRITQPVDLKEQMRIRQLESALSSSSPEIAVTSYAEAVKKRNGAWQYALMTPALQDKNYLELKSGNWVTGTSSPWVDRYSLGDAVENKDGSVTIRVTYVLTDSTASITRTAEDLTLAEKDGIWQIAGIDPVEAE